MISFLEGIVDGSAPLEVTLNCGGVGYRVEIPVTTAERLPGNGQKTRLHIHPVYREDSQALYGFITPEERDFFRLLTTRVSGIGPKIALNLMSRLSFSMLREAIGRGDAALLTKCPGIGKKTAERLCIELKDTLGLPGNAASGTRPVAYSTHTPAGAYSDAVQALMALGYKLDAADQAVKKASQALGPEVPTGELVKAALRGQT